MRPVADVVLKALRWRRIDSNDKVVPVNLSAVTVAENIACGASGSINSANTSRMSQRMVHSPLDPTTASVLFRIRLNISSSPLPHQPRFRMGIHLGGSGFEGDAK